MDATTYKYVQLIEDNKLTIAKILKKGNICELSKAINGIKVVEIKKSTKRV